MLELKLALRFVASRRKGALTRFISFASTCGIAMGVFAAIVGFSAMNGFEYELEHRVLSVVPYAQLNSGAASFKDAEAIEKALKEDPHIVSTAQAISQNAILSNNANFAPVLLNGIKPDAENHVISIQRFVSIPLTCLDPENYDKPECAIPNGKIGIATDSSTKTASSDSVKTSSDDDKNVSISAKSDVKGDKSAAQSDAKDGKNAAQGDKATARAGTKDAIEALPNESDDGIGNGAMHHMPRIVLGAAVAKKLGTTVGDSIYLVSLGVHDNAANRSLEASTLSSSLRMPEKTKVEVAGIVKIGGQIDTSIAIMFFDDLKEISKLDGANTIHIKTDSLVNADRIVYAAARGKIHENAYLMTWMSTQGKLYHDIQMVRQIMFVAMFLVLAVACFNIISNLMMLVGEKRREIAILLTMGMRPRTIVRTFSLMGLISGGYGAIIGLVLGIIVSLSITPVTQSFQDWFGFPLLNEDVYFINFIPCRLAVLDVVLVIFIALLMSVLAALYPALRAARVKPAHELNI